MPEYRLAWWWGPDGGLTGGPLPGGIVRLAVDYGGLAAFECGILPGGGRTVLLADHAVPVPAGGGMEFRAPGLWTEMVVEEPGEYLSVGLEAFAVAVDDPDDAWRGGPDHLFRGERLPVGLDLGAERVAEPVEFAGSVGATAIPCRVVGEVLVADEVYEVDGWGWWLDGQTPVGHLLGRDADGGWVASSLPDAVETVGRAPVLGAGGTPVDRRLVRFAEGGRPGAAWVEELGLLEG